jgi:hypothetical protein
MDLDTLLADAAPARHLPLDGPDSPAAVRLYRRITAQPPGASRPSRRRRLVVPALIGVAAAAVAATVALALMPGSPAAPGHRGGQGRTTLAAWSVIRERHGLVKVTIRELRDPAGLQQMLRAAGVPLNVRFLHHDFMASTSTRGLPKGCLAPRMSNQANAKLQAKIMPGIPSLQDGVVVNIRPSAIPHGIGLYLKAWAASPGTQSGAFLSLQIDLVQATPQCTGS